MLYTGLPTVAIFATSASYQQGTWFKTGGSNTIIFVETHRKYCADLLHVLYHFWHSRSSGLNRYLLHLATVHRNWFVCQQLFKGSFFYCEGPNIRSVRNRTDCLAADPRNMWVNRAYNFDDLGQALMALFVLSSKDGWVNIMYTGLDAVGVDQQVCISVFNF